MNESEIRQRLLKAVGETSYPPGLATRIEAHLREAPPEQRQRVPRFVALVAAVLAIAIVATFFFISANRPRQSVLVNPGPTASPSPTPPIATSPTPPPAPVAAGLWPRATNLAYDSTRGQVLLFGGASASVANDTWTWDGSSWTQRTSAANPSARQGAAIADDPDRHVVLLFGGDTSGNYLGDTWLWDGSTWRQAQPAHSPSPRTGAAITYDPVHHVAILFGGSAGFVLGDTWLWDGNDWTQKTPATSPPPRQDARFAFDIARGNAVLFGGFDGMNDTWTWDGTNWTQQHPANTPPGFKEATPVPQQMVYDVARQVIVFVGPTQHAADMASNTMDTWTWNGTTWTRLTPAPAPPIRDGFGLAYDASHSMTVFAGGFPFGGADATSTWGWNGVDWSQLG